VSTVLGLVGRDLLLDAVQAVADEDAAAAFALTARAVDLGYDLRAVCRELSRVVRDLLVLSVDPSRISDPEIAGESERERLKAIAGRFSREDLLRAFDVLTKAETDIRAAAQPRYHLEMAFLRWIYLRKLVPIEDLIAGAGGPERPAPRATSASFAAPPTPAAGPAPARPAPASTPRVSASTSSAPSPAPPAAAAASARSDTNLKRAAGEVRKSKAVFYNGVAQAQKIDGRRSRDVHVLKPSHVATCSNSSARVAGVPQQVSGRRW
jgi:DNA polymerase-3 subunit gamma/tau